MPNINIQTCTSLNNISATHWNALHDQSNPFLKYEFLIALERHQCVSQYTGWHPHHFLAFDENETLIGAVPTYLKTNSFGEFVFDWAWASAYEQAGLQYYPKLVSAIPFTPVTGPRFLVHNKNTDVIKSALHQAMINTAKEQQLSSIHWLFPHTQDTQWLEETTMLSRLAYQYHWKNNNYRDFDDFLSHFKSRKRKNTLRERKHIHTANIEIEIKQGDELTEAEWQQAHYFYELTFKQKGNYPSLTLAFFLEIAETMGENIIVVFARQKNNIIAAAINFKSNDALFGRYWGCNQNFNNLHFEVCFYQGIEYCIENNIQRFEPGAQGEHKITRGFLPTPTWSSHWIADRRFKPAIKDFLDREYKALQHYKETDLDTMSPFKSTDS